jgi:hypothetical protein
MARGYILIGIDFLYLKYSEQMSRCPAPFLSCLSRIASNQTHIQWMASNSYLAVYSFSDLCTISDLTYVYDMKLGPKYSVGRYEYLGILGFLLWESHHI